MPPSVGNSVTSLENSSWITDVDLNFDFIYVTTEL